MKRIAYQDLLLWKNTRDRKPLIVQGARQVGKTYLIKEFGKKEYAEYFYFNFEENQDLKSLFESSLEASSLIESLSTFAGKKIDVLSALIFFDEIQVCQRALTSLKYFCEQLPGSHIIAAGSLLGVSVGKTSSFPVGKVSFLTLRPLTFFEYLDASGEELLKKHLLDKKDFNPLTEAFHTKLMNSLRYFLFLGGMPAVVAHYTVNKDPVVARRLQKEILEAYSRDFSKYSTSTEAIRISELWQSIPAHLVRENKKFLYSSVHKGARAAWFESAIEWLRSAGLIYQATCVTTAKPPLGAYISPGKFKAYLHDTGLMGAMMNIEAKSVVIGDSIISEYNGAMTENFVATELVAKSNERLYYWRSENIAEVDFLLQKETAILPLEVKSGMSRDTKSLRFFQEKYSSKKIYRTSPRNFTQDNDFINIPLYAMGCFPDLS